MACGELEHLSPVGLKVAAPHKHNSTGLHTAGIGSLWISASSDSSKISHSQPGRSKLKKAQHSIIRENDVDTMEYNNGYNMIQLHSDLRMTQR